MNSETHITDYFKREFRKLKKQLTDLQEAKANPEVIVLESKISTTYNIAVEVLGAHVAGQMADDAGL